MHDELHDIPDPPEPRDDIDPDEPDPTAMTDHAHFSETHPQTNTTPAATSVQATPAGPAPLSTHPHLRLVPDHAAADLTLRVEEPLALERACLGALITEPRLLRSVPVLRDHHFVESAAHAAVFRAIEAAEAEGGSALPGHDQVRHHLELDPGFRPDGHVGLFVLGLVQACVSTANVAWYAQRVLANARRHQLGMLSRQMVALAGQGLAEDELIERGAVLLDRAQPMLTPLDVTSAGGLPEGLMEFADLARSAPDPTTWVVPGLLQAGDRVIVVAGEGSGKSTLQRSVAAAVSQGRHPFILSVEIPAQRTLIVDLENPRGIIRESAEAIVGHLEHRAPWSHGLMWLWSQPGGIDLRRREAQVMLERVVEHCRPRLICLGPIYKSYVEGSNDKAAAAAREVQAVLDHLRVTYGCALWLEAHAPLEQQGKRKLRPFGSQVWQAWPEFGIGLAPDRSDKTGRTFELERWRHDRIFREWPSHVRRAERLSSDHWLWECTWDQGMPEWLNNRRLTAPGSLYGGQA